MAYALQARVVFPVDRPPIEHGVVTIEGNRIVAVGTKAEAGDVIDLGRVALLPGLVNCHTHLEFSYLRRPLGSPGMRLVDWIRLVIAERGCGDDATQIALALGITESYRYGVTFIGDITTTYRPQHISLGDSIVFVEVIGFSRARAASSLAAVTASLDWGDEWLTERALISFGKLRCGISPHAPYTVSPDLLLRLITLANARGLPVAMHLAESAEELELLRSGTGPFQELLDERSMWDASAIPRGSRPLDYLRMLAEAPRSLVIHGNYLDDDEQSFLGANADRMSLIYCPRTHAYFGHRPYPLAELLKKNVRVALGTDSRASNPNLDLLAEMHYVEREFPTIDPQDILRMGTLAGAEALGRDGEVGSLSPGKLANLVSVSLAKDERGKPGELLAAVLALAEPSRNVWVRGAKVE